MRPPSRLSRLSHRQRFDLAAGGVVLLIVVALGGGLLLQRHPTVRSIQEHVNAEYRAGQAPHLSDAEIAALAQAQRETKVTSHWERMDVGDAPVTRLEAPGERALRVGYTDGFIDLSDARYRVTPDDVDPIDQASERRAVVAGGPGGAMIGGCCESSEARVTVALRRSAPPTAPASRWPAASEIDLDLSTGALVFSSTDGPEAVVDVPSGRYRVRVSSAGAIENEQDKDAYLVELWPRTRDTPLRVLRPTVA